MERIPMANRAQDIVTQVSTMPDAEKLKLVDLMLRQLDKPDPEIDKVWAQEARKRWQAYREGKLGTVSYEQVMEKHQR
jgi:hypothetical protein